MARKSHLARTIIIAVIGIVVVIGLIKFIPKITGKKPEEVKPEDKKEGEKKEGEKAEGEKQEAAEEEQEPVGVKVIKAQKADFQDLLPVMGTSEGLSEIDLKFEVPGTIEFFNFKEGDRVRKGDVIARLDNKDALLKVKYRKAKLAVALT